jgi:hypothetical protein
LISLPLTVALNLDHSFIDGQQESLGMHRHWDVMFWLAKVTPARMAKKDNLANIVMTFVMLKVKTNYRLLTLADWFIFHKIEHDQMEYIR